MGLVDDLAAIWNFDAMRLRGAVIVDGICPVLLPLTYRRRGDGRGEIWLELEDPPSIYDTERPVYKGPEASCEAVIGLFAWWHARH